MGSSKDSLIRDSGEEGAEDVEGADFDPGVGVEFEVAENVFADAAAHLSGQRQQQGLAELRLDKPAEFPGMVAGERHELVGGGRKAEGGGQPEQEEEVEIAEIAIQGVQGEDLPVAPVEQRVVTLSVPDHPVQHLAHEHGHRVLAEIAPQPAQRMPDRRGHRIPERGAGILHDVRLQQAERLEKGHGGPLSDAHEKTPPSVNPRKGMDDDAVFSELRVVQDDEIRVVFQSQGPFVRAVPAGRRRGQSVASWRKAAMARSALPRWEMAFLTSSPSWASVRLSVLGRSRPSGPGISSGMKTGS